MTDCISLLCEKTFCLVLSCLVLSGMNINVDKTKNIKNFRFENEHIFTTNSYKYLGVVATTSGGGLIDLIIRALRAYFKLKSNMGQYFKLDPEVTLKLFDTLIKPILLYVSDFSGCLKMPSNNPMENTHRRFCKDLLGVQRQTSNIGVLLDLGRIPIMIYGEKMHNKLVKD